MTETELITEMPAQLRVDKGETSEAPKTPAMSDEGRVGLGLEAIQQVVPSPDRHPRVPIPSDQVTPQMLRIADQGSTVEPSTVRPSPPDALDGLASPWPLPSTKALQDYKRKSDNT